MSDEHTEEQQEQQANGEAEPFDLDDFFMGNVEVVVNHKGRRTFHELRNPTTAESLEYQRRLAGFGKNGKPAFEQLYDAICTGVQVEVADGKRVDVPDFRAKVKGNVKMHAVLAYQSLTYATEQEAEKN